MMFLKTKCSHRVSSKFPGEPSIHRTTFDNVNEYALENVKDAYEALPSYKSLKFEYMIKTTMDLTFNHKKEFLPVRLVLGYLKSSRKRSRLALHAYIRMHNQRSKMFLHLGGSSLDQMELEAPFNFVYETYGMTEKAINRLCTMAAYYFLAAGHVEAIMTRQDYRLSFSVLCTKIQPLQGLAGVWNSNDETATDTTKTPPGAPKDSERVHQSRPRQRNGLGQFTPTACDSKILAREMAQPQDHATIATPASSGNLSADNHHLLESRGKTPVSTKWPRLDLH